MLAVIGLYGVLGESARLTLVGSAIGLAGAPTRILAPGDWDG